VSARRFVVDAQGLSDHELAAIHAMLARAPQDPPTLADIWRLMDGAWAELGCDEYAPTEECLGSFYRHPVWALNGMFVEQDAESRGHREAIAAYLRRLAPGRILDYGGGYGSMARLAAAALPASRVELYEPFPSAAALARAAPFANLRFVSRPGAAYDAALCLDVLEHVPDPLPPLIALAESLRAGGRLVIANNFYPLIRCHLPATFHLRYSFPLFAALLGLRREGRLPGAAATIYRNVRSTAAPWRALRLLEAASRAAYPGLRGAHRAYQRARGRTGRL
jgi:SAM-dependent methyltransferase